MATRKILPYNKRAKLALDSFLNNFRSRVVSKSPLPKSSSRVSQDCGSSISTPSRPNFSRFFPYSSISQRSGLLIGNNRYHQYSTFSNGAKRFYRRSVQDFWPPNPRGWLRNNPRMVFVGLLVGSGVVLTVCFGSLETIPYSKRTHLVLLPVKLERWLGESYFTDIKDSYKRRILPLNHPQSVRVRSIMKEITGALERGLRPKQVCSELEYDSPEVASRDLSGHDTTFALGEGGEGKVKTKRDKGQEKGLQAKASLLDGLNWEVLVVDSPVVNAFCLPSGKIVVFTGLLKHFKRDDELATIIGHEVAHAVARHSAETLTKNIWIAIIQLIIHQYISDLSIETSNTLSKFLLKLPFSRKMEMEADYIGLLLMAAAGFDPRVAPTVYKKLGKLSGDKTSKLEDYLSTHPSGKKRAESLAKAKVMEKAIGIFKEVRAGREDEGH